MDKIGNKNKEFSTTLKMKINDIELSIGELQFHIKSRKVIKFRFFKKFLEYIQE